MCGFYFITLIEYMLEEKSMLDYINLLLSIYCKRHGKIIYKQFEDKHVKPQI